MLLSRTIPDLHRVRVLIREIFRGWNEPELPEDVLHDGPGHHDADIIAFCQPLPDKVLAVALVLLPRDDVVQAEPVLLIKFQPPGEESFSKSECIPLGGSGLDSFCGYE